MKSSRVEGKELKQKSGNFLAKVKMNFNGLMIQIRKKAA
jgi:hypothetical protein